MHKFEHTTLRHIQVVYRLYFVYTVICFIDTHICTHVTVTYLLLSFYIHQVLL